MNDRQKNIVLTCLMAALLFVIAFWCWGKDADEFSVSERRALAVMPELSGEAVLSGEFMTEFESYSLDQFPCRDQLRSLKAFTVYHVFQQKDNNAIYLADAHISKLNYPLNEAMTDHAAERFRHLHDAYFAGTDVNVYFSIVPDKNYFLAEPNGYLSLDYPALFAQMQEKTDFMQYIDISDLLTLDCYYRTDTHWRQEKILPVAERLAEMMGVPFVDDYTVNQLPEPFYGTYVGQSALPLSPDTIYYLTNEVLSSCTVTSYDTGYPVGISMYTLEEAAGGDPYDIFLGGADALIVIENPNALTDRELVVFRDSFGSSLVPLLVGSYTKVTLADIRYIRSDYLSSFIDFDDQDVLFLYSTLLLNDSLALR